MIFLLDKMAPDEFCKQTASIWGIIGWLVMILKIVIPLLLIIFGMLDLGKAVIASDDKAINKGVTTLLHRFIAGVIVFFVPSLVLALFNAFTGFNISTKSEDTYGRCIKCVLNVNAQDECYCKSPNTFGDDECSSKRDSNNSVTYKAIIKCDNETVTTATTSSRDECDNYVKTHTPSCSGKITYTCVRQ